MVLKEPLGTVDRDLTFRWNRVEGAASYILLVTARDRDEVELLRPVHETFLKPSETEISNFNPGSYAWTVEARSAKGQLIGYGEGSFAISTSRLIPARDLLLNSGAMRKTPMTPEADASTPRRDRSRSAGLGGSTTCASPETSTRWVTALSATRRA